MARLGVGSILFMWGARRRRVVGAFASMVGGAMVHRSFAELIDQLGSRVRERTESGHIDADRDLDRHFGDGTRDIVEEASWESFPASDPPSYTR